MKPLMPSDGTWRDATSYSRNEKVSETEPRTWKLEMGDVSVTVTKHIHYGDEWTIVSDDLDIRQNGLGTTDAAVAKKEAVRIARRACEDRLEELERMLNKLKEL